MDEFDDELEIVPVEKDYHRYTADERVVLIDKLLEARMRSRASWVELSMQFGISRATINRWQQTDEWRQAEARWRRIIREETRTDVAVVGQDMVGVLQDLAHQARSEFVRYSAASKLLDLFGVGDEIAETQADQTGELLDFFKQLDARNRERERLAAQGIDLAAVIDAEVKPGGALPDAIVAQNREIVERALRQEDPEA